LAPFSRPAAAGGFETRVRWHTTHRGLFFFFYFFFGEFNGRSLGGTAPRGTHHRFVAKYRPEPRSFFSIIIIIIVVIVIFFFCLFVVVVVDIDIAAGSFREHTDSRQQPEL